MNSSQTMKSKRTIAQQFDSIHLSNMLRAAALRSVVIAKSLADAIVRACEESARKRAETVMKSGVYYWE
jgi:hypothetical protein